MKNELVSILSDLIALPSPYPPGTSVEICAYAAKRLKKAGYKVEIATRKKGVDNVVARMKGKGKGPVIAFNAHVDTVKVMVHTKLLGANHPTALALTSELEDQTKQIIAAQGKA